MRSNEPPDEGKKKIPKGSRPSWGVEAAGYMGKAPRVNNVGLKAIYLGGAMFRSRKKVEIVVPQGPVPEGKKLTPNRR